MNSPGAPAGWYPDAHDEGQEQYWDGQRWTDAKRPSQREPSVPAKQTEDRGSTALVVVGYITAVLLPIVGFILGIVLLVRRQTGHGLAVFLISIAVMIGGCALLLSDTENELNSYSDCIDQADTVREMARC